MRPVYAALSATVILFASAAPASGQVIQIDPYPLDASEGSRKIPDLVNGGETELDWDHIIDIVILGDGYCDYSYDPNDPNDPNACPCGINGQPPIGVFVDDATACYEQLFGDPNAIPPIPGIRPYEDFAAAFRVRAVFNKSDVCASPDRDSYYRVSVVHVPKCGVATMDGWWNDSGADNWFFRQRLYNAIDELDPPVNYALYDDLDNPPDPDPNSCYEDVDVDFFYPRNHVYRNLVVVMLVRADCSATNLSGGVLCVCRETNCQPSEESQRVRVAMAEPSDHEFTHAFADVFDEYIRDRDRDAFYSNPDEGSVFTLWNVSYSNERCDLLWPHLAPGGQYNPDLRSPIGRLYAGARCEKGVWHSEYLCMMNGTSDNYECDVDPNDTPKTLKTCGQLCFWCQEVVAVKILEKTGQFIRPGDPSDIDELGRTWYQLWDSELRDGYYWYFDVPARIAERNDHYAVCDGDPNCPYFMDCSDPPNEILVPECLVGCGIAEYGNAIYVDSLLGHPDNSGSRAEPLDNIEDAVVRANDVCGGLPLVAIKPGSYPPQTITGPAILVAEACDSVVIGK